MSNYRLHGYILPYSAEIGETGFEDKALLYAIMRQESDYIPSAISYTFAIGLMQLMPFLIDHIAKQRHEKIASYTQLFNPRKNLLYATVHLRWLQRRLGKNVLFIAYAYNGGYGYLKRYLRANRFKNGAYEPFMSIELMINSQTREYGKRVLANYAIYKEIFNEPFLLPSFFQTLK